LLVAVPRDFNIARFTRSRDEYHFQTQNPILKMTSTRVELSFNKITRLNDLSDLAELLFPGNRNQQHAFLVVWLAIKWADHHIVPKLAGAAKQHDVSRRTLERVRAKMRRMGLIDHVSRFNAKHGYREGWVFSGRFERGLRELAEKVAGLKDPVVGSREKDVLVLKLLDGARQAVRDAKHVTQDHDVHEVMQVETE
jgi:hypothetical protein